MSFLTKTASPEAPAHSHRQDAYHPHVDGLRAIAVLSVILFHLRVAGIPGGFVGVDVFFVISGFVITEMIARLVHVGTFSFANFYERRARRIVPGLIALLIVATLSATLTLSPADLVMFGKSMGASLLFGANFFFYNHNGYFDSDVETKPLLHLWSLGVEAQFYLFWPLVAVWMLKPPSYLKRWLTLIILSAVSVCIAMAMAGSQSSGGFYLLPSRIFEFLIGGALVWMPSIVTSREKPFADVLMIIGLAMIGLSIAYYNEHIPFPSYYALLPCLGTALVIHGGYDADMRAILSNRVMVYLGKISYELYLFHWVAIVFFRYQTDKSLNQTNDLILFAVTFVLSVLTYHFVTRPLRYGYAHTLPQRQNMLLGLLCVCVLLLGTAISMKLSDGWAWRIPQAARLFVHDPGKFHETNFGGAGIQGDTLITLGDESQPPQFLIFGDSFTAQYGLALSDFLKEHHESAYLYTISGCLMMPHVYAYGPERVTPACRNAFLKVQQILQNTPNMPVIQAQSWSTYKDSVHRLDGTPVSFPKETNNDYYQFLIDGIEQSRQALKGHRYLFVGISPGISEQKSLARCFIVPTYLPNACAANVAAKEEERLNGQEFNLAAAQYASAHPDVTFINPRTAMCHDGLCYAINQKKIFYSDYSHFTRDGARQVIDKYQDVILSLHP